MVNKRIIIWILFLALACRLYHIIFPVEGWHAWRQADTAAIARNFYDNGFDLFHPQINHGGDTPGYVDVEFPVYPYLVALLWKVFGVNDGWGRFVSVLSSLGTIYYLYALTRKYVGEAAGLWSAFIYSILPLNVYYARTFMPHALILLCTVCGIYFFSEWIERKERPMFILSSFFIAVATLMNPTTLVIGLPLAYLASLSFGKQWIRVSSLWIYGIIVITPSIVWYTYSHLELYSPNLTIGIWHFGTDKWGNFDLLASPKFYNDLFLKSIAERHLTYAATIPFIVGLFLKRQRPEERMFDWWLIAVIVYFLVVAKGNDVHEYYQLPFILPAIIYVGKTFAAYIAPASDGSRTVTRPWRWFLSFCLIAIVPLSFVRYYESFAQREVPQSVVTRLADEIDTITGLHDLMITVSEGDAVLLYRSHRKGWVVHPDNIDTAYIADKRMHGAKYIVGLKSIFDTDDRQARLLELMRRLPPMNNNTEYFVIQLFPQ